MIWRRRFSLVLSAVLLVALGPACGTAGGGATGAGVGVDAAGAVLLSGAHLPADLPILADVDVAWVSDGDTATVLVDGVSRKIRFYGVDTPESDQPRGDEAKRFTEGLLDGAVVDVRLLPGEVTYGREVGIVIADERVVNAALLDAGLAWFYADYCDRSDPCDEWQALEAGARAAARGLWADDDRIAPWDWRRTH